MAILSLPKFYRAGAALNKSALDAIVSGVEDFVNDTQLGYENIEVQQVLNSFTSTYADYVTTNGGFGSFVSNVLMSDELITSTATSYFLPVTVSSPGFYLVNLLILRDGGAPCVSVPPQQGGGVQAQGSAEVTLKRVSSGQNITDYMMSYSYSGLQGFSIAYSGVTNFIDVIKIDSIDTLVVNFPLVQGEFSNLKAGSVLQIFKLRNLV